MLALYSTSWPTLMSPPARCAIAAIASAIARRSGSAARRSHTMAAPMTITKARIGGLLLAGESFPCGLPGHSEGFSDPRPGHADRARLENQPGEVALDL